MSGPECRLCGAELTTTFVDLGMSPPCETYLAAGDLDNAETFYPLHVRICDRCLLVQLPAYVAAQDIFSDYAYFSSYSDSWVATRSDSSPTSSPSASWTRGAFVVEVASNDGYLLQEVVRRGIRCLGIEPAANVAAVARERGIPPRSRSCPSGAARRSPTKHGRGGSGRGQQRLCPRPGHHRLRPRPARTGRRGRRGVAGVSAPAAPHRGRQYDTIYHEHYSYFTLRTAAAALAAAGLTVVHVEELASHGGSLRVMCSPAATAVPDRPSQRLLDDEAAAGLRRCRGTPASLQPSSRSRPTLSSSWCKPRSDGLRVGGLRRTRQGQHPAQPLRHPDGPARYTVDRNRLQAGTVPARHAHPDPRTGAAGRRPARLILILPWNLRDRDRRAAGVHPGVGRAVRRPIPALAIV